MADPTPGAVAYAAYTTSCGFMHQPPFDDLRLFEQRAWEAAAQAVLALAQEDSHE